VFKYIKTKIFIRDPSTLHNLKGTYRTGSIIIGNNYCLQNTKHFQAVHLKASYIWNIYLKCIHTIKSNFDRQL